MNKLMKIRFIVTSIQFCLIMNKFGTKNEPVIWNNENMNLMGLHDCIVVCNYNTTDIVTYQCYIIHPLQSRLNVLF